MKKVVFLLCVALVVIILASDGQTADPIQWHHELDTGLRLAKASQKPILVDIGTEQCSWCKKLDVMTFRDPGVMKKLKEQFITVKIDGNRDPRTVERFQVTGFPTLIFLSPDGRVLDVQPGYLDAQAMLKRLDGVLAKMPEPQAVVRPTPVPTVQTVSIPSPESLGIRLVDLPPQVVPSISKLDEQRSQLLVQLAELDLQRATLAETAGDIPKATEILRGILSFAGGTPAGDKAQARLVQLVN